MDYTTQMDAARKGILTGQLRAVAVEEKMEAERLRELVAKGQAVIPANKNHAVFLSFHSCGKKRTLLWKD